MTDGEFVWPSKVNRRWRIDGVDRPLPQLKQIVYLYAPVGAREECAYRVVWVNHKTHKVGMKLMGV